MNGGLQGGVAVGAPIALRALRSREGPGLPSTPSGFSGTKRGHRDHVFAWDRVEQSAGVTIVIDERDAAA